MIMGHSPNIDVFSKGELHVPIRKPHGIMAMTMACVSSHVAGGLAAMMGHHI